MLSQTESLSFKIIFVLLMLAIKRITIHKNSAIVFFAFQIPRLI